MFFEQNRAFVTVSDIKHMADNQYRNEISQAIVDDDRYFGSHINSGWTGNGWVADPDGGTIGQRLSGDFEWAFDIIRRQQKAVGEAGNVQSIIPEIEWGHLDGQEVDFDQYMIRDPRCLGRLVANPNEDGNKVIRIAIGIGGSAVESCAEIAERAAKILKFAKYYEDAGYSIELFGFDGSWQRYKKAVGVTVVDCSKATLGQSLAILCSTLIYRSVLFQVSSNMGHSPNSSQPIHCHANDDKMAQCEKLVKSLIGNDAKIIFAGMSDAEVLDRLK